MRFRDGLSRHLQGLSHQQALTRFKDAFGFTPGVIYDLGAYHGNRTTLARRVYPDRLVKETVGTAAQKADSALIMFVDEMQHVAEDELAALIMALHRCVQRKLPIALVGAGATSITRSDGGREILR